MTAGSVIIRREGLHVLTDGLGFDHDTGAHSLASKVLSIAHLRAALVVRGPMLVVPHGHPDANP